MALCVYANADLHQLNHYHQSDKAVTVNAIFDIQVISLQRREDRWQAIRSALSKQGLQFNRFLAMDGKKKFLSNKALVSERIVDEKSLLHNPYITRGAVALSLTSRSLWKHAAKSPKPYTVVIEDDMLLKEDFVDKLYDLASYIQKYPFDVLLLHHSPWKHWSPNKSERNNSFNAEWMERNSQEKIINSIFGSSAACYVINNRVSPERLLQAFSLPFDSNVDMFWWGTKEKISKTAPHEYGLHKLTKNTKANKLTVMQVHPLWYSGSCATTSQCQNGKVSSRDSEIHPEVFKENNTNSKPHTEKVRS